MDRKSVIAVFRNNLTQTSSVSTTFSTDSTYFETKLHTFANFSADDFRISKSSLSASSNGNYTTAQKLSINKIETSKFVTTNMTFGATTTVSALSSMLLKDELAKDTNSPISTSSSHGSNFANNFLDCPVNVAALSSAAGVVGLGASCILIYHASRRCRMPLAIRFVTGYNIF